MKTRPTYLNKNDILIESNININQLEHGFLNNHKPKAIVIGAGPAGLASAIDLREQGFDVLLVEKRAAFSRSNIVGVNRMALPWFQQHQLLDDLLENSNLTSNYPSVIDANELMLNANRWLEDAASTTNTIAIKSLQELLLKKYTMLSNPGKSYILTNANVEISDKNTLTLEADAKIQIDLAAIKVVIVADGSQSQTRERLHTLFTDHHASALNKVKLVPEQQFANIIVDTKPNALKPGVYLHTDIETGLAMAFSVSEKEISINFQTLQAQDAGSKQIVSNLIQEAAANLQKFLVKLNQSQGLEMQLDSDARYYPIHGGRISHGFSTQDTISEELTIKMKHIIFETPSTYAAELVYGDKFVLVGDTKGTSSPMAGLGASLALAFDPSVIASVAEDLKHQDKAVIAAAFRKISVGLQRSIATWVQKAIAKLQLKLDLEIVGAHLITKAKYESNLSLATDSNRLFSYNPGVQTIATTLVRAVR